MSSSPSTQRLIADLSLKLYTLESSVYYISGLLDEGIPVVLDVENALILVSLDNLHEIFCILEIDKRASLGHGALLRWGARIVLQPGLKTVWEEYQRRNSDSRYVHRGRQCGTDLRRHIVHVDCQQKEVRIWSRRILYAYSITGTLKRLLFNEKITSDLKNPKLQHYIAEHAHPSLQVLPSFNTNIFFLLQLACQELEFSMSRVNAVISKMISEQGKNIVQDFGSIEGLARVLQVLRNIVNF